MKLTATRQVRVTLAAANYTAELLASDDRCPVTDPDSDGFTVGFDVTIFNPRLDPDGSIAARLTECLVRAFRA